MLFDLSVTADLASHSLPLRSYDNIQINHFCLAGFGEPHSLASVALDHFHIVPEQSFAFVLFIKEGFEPSPIPQNGIALPLSYLRTYEDVLLQLLHILLDTEYNTPSIFLLAGYSIILHDSGHPFLVCIAALPFLAKSDSATTR